MSNTIRNNELEPVQTIRLLADDTIAPFTLNAAIRFGYELVCTAEVLEEPNNLTIFNYACTEGFALLTMSKTFTQYTLYDHAQSNGVIVLPQPAHGSGRETELMISKALQNLSAVHTEVMQGNKGLTLQYYPNDRVEIYQPAPNVPSKRLLILVDRYMK